VIGWDKKVKFPGTSLGKLRMRESKRKKLRRPLREKNNAEVCGEDRGHTGLEGATDLMNGRPVREPSVRRARSPVLASSVG
jgi:hypothetical protein